MKVHAMAKKQLNEEYRQSDIDALIMEQAEKKELEAMCERMNLLLRDFYSANVHPVNFGVGVNTKHNDGATTAIQAAQGETHDHKD
ncbi:MAG TPA: hypothetical protein DIW28_05690 [Zetaproteobacteria bacterium]|nr:hypothetical protein [Zetaproteobacteria bacterium]